MNPLPLVLREFNVANRRPATRRVWLWFGGGSMLATVWSLLVSNGDSAGEVFRALTAIAMVLGMAVAIYTGSDSISRERREGTLGFLFLTDLSAWDVALGKFSAIGLVPIYTLLGMFPAFALCQLMGGVAAGYFVKMMFALLASLLFSIGAALYVSSRCEDHRKAFAGTAAVLLLANPLLLWYAAGELRTLSFFGVLLSFFGVAGLFLRGAVKRLARHWRDQEVTVKKEELATAGRAARILLEKAPVGWMMLRRHGSTVWSERAAVLLAIFGLALLFGVSLLAIQPVLWLLLAAHVIYVIVMLTRTAYAFYTDRRNGALELLLGTPLGNEEIFDGLNCFLLRKSSLLVWLLTGVDIVLAGYFASWKAYPLAALPLAMAAGLWITVWGLGWVGVYRSLMMKHPSLAVPATFARLSFVPVLLSLLFLAAPRTDLAKVAAFYVLATGFLAAFFSIDAKQALVVHGRTLLLRPENEKPPHIENDWTFIDWQQDENANSPPIPAEILEEKRLQENPY